MKKRTLGILVSLAGATLAIGFLAAPSRQSCAAQPPISFSEDVAPIFRGYCISCHHPGGEGFEKSGLDLSSYEGVMKGTKFGPMVVAGNPDTSNLMWLLDWRASQAIRMPHGKKQLPACERDIIRTWIFQGAKDN